jgi:uncharacterized protein YqeY
MTLLAKLQQDRITALKNKQQQLKDSLTTLYAEAVRVGKDDRKTGPRESTDAEVIKVIKTTIENNSYTMDLLEDKVLMTAEDVQSIQDKTRENEIFTKYLPKQLTNEDMVGIVDGLITNGVKTLPEIQKFFKTNHLGTYDGGALTVIIKGKVNV